MFESVSHHHIEEAISAIKTRAIGKLGSLYEKENNLFREVCLKTTPRLDYWAKATYDVFDKVTNLRNDGIPAYAGTDAGANIHIFTLPNHVERVARVVREVEGVVDTIQCRVGEGSRLIAE